MAAQPAAWDCRVVPSWASNAEPVKVLSEIIAKVLTDIPGSSNWFLGGVVAYSNTLKQSLLGVLPSTLHAHGAVSEATAREMAIGALETLGGHVAVAVTGIAGPDGGQPGKPVGTVWFGWAWRVDGEIETRVALETFAGDREAVRRLAVQRRGLPRARVRSRRSSAHGSRFLRSRPQPRRDVEGVRACGAPDRLDRTHPGGGAAPGQDR